MGLENLTKHGVVFLDPPYPNANVRSYRNDTLNHEELVDCLLRAKFRWLLSGYAHPIWRRLGDPFWAKDVKLLSIRGEQQARTECVWSSFQSKSGRKALPPTLNDRLKNLDEAATLSFSALDAKIDTGLEKVAKDWNALEPRRAVPTFPLSLLSTYPPFYAFYVSSLTPPQKPGISATLPLGPILGLIVMGPISTHQLDLNCRAGFHFAGGRL